MHVSDSFLIAATYMGVFHYEPLIDKHITFKKNMNYFNKLEKLVIFPSMEYNTFCTKIFWELF